VLAAFRPSVSMIIDPEAGFVNVSNPVVVPVVPLAD
jgi:hypothetical protein